MEITMHTDGFEGFRRRSLMDRGEKIQPEKSITFENPMDMMKVLSQKFVT